MGKFKNKTLASELGLFFITMIWGSAFVVVKSATKFISPGYMIALRFAIATLLLCILFPKKLKKINRNYIRNGLLIGLLNFLGFEFQTIGVMYTTAGKNAFLTAVYCVLVPFLYWLFRRIRPDRYNIISALLCITGIGLLSLREGFSMNIGDALSLLCGLMFGLQIVVISILTENSDPILLCITLCASTGVMASVWAAFTEHPPQLTRDSVFSVLFLGIFSTMVADLLQFVCQKYTPPAKASLIMSLESVFGTLAGILVLHESVTTKSLFGFILIFIAILLSEVKPAFLQKRARKENTGPEKTESVP